MTKLQLIATSEREASVVLQNVNEILGRMITSAKSPMAPLALSEATVMKVIEAREAVREAARIIEREARAAHVAAMEGK